LINGEVPAPATHAAGDRVLVAPDKFKGSLTAVEVAGALADGFFAGTGVHAAVLPLADGGDGSVAAAIASGYALHSVPVVDAFGRPHHADIAFDGHTAIVEMANTCGLAITDPRALRPLTATSRGLGEALAAALRLHPRRVVIAPGGSASTDGGAGLLDALGWSLVDHEGRPIPPGAAQLNYAAALVACGPALPPDVDLVLATDVDNPLYGASGAAATYGPQKGASTAEVIHLDAGLRALAQAARASFGDRHVDDAAHTPGAGSGGGVGFAALLMGARVVSGGEFFLDLTGFDAAARRADLIITGEGSLDHQTLRGKLLAAVARRAADTEIVAVVGRCTLPRADWPKLRLRAVYAVSDRSNRDTASDPQLTHDSLVSIGREIGSRYPATGRLPATMD
jgi:glycerate 2-kinase